MFWGIHSTVLVVVSFFIKYNVELFLLIDIIIYMGKVADSLFLPEKITPSSWEE